MSLNEISIVVVGTFFSMAMLSTLYGKGNPLYSLAEESYIGFATGLSIIVNLTYIWRAGIANIQAGDFILVGGIFLGLLTLLRFSPNYRWIAKLSIAVVMGTQFGLSIRTIIFTGFLAQINSIIQPLFSGGWITLFYRWTLAISVITMLTFFIYTKELKGTLLGSSRIGESLLYAAFGAIFAQTFMGRSGLFIGFLQNYTVPRWEIPILIASMLIVFAIVLLLDRMKIIDKWIPEE